MAKRVTQNVISLVVLLGFAVAGFVVAGWISQPRNGVGVGGGASVISVELSSAFLIREKERVQELLAASNSEQLSEIFHRIDQNARDDKRELMSVALLCSRWAQLAPEEGFEFFLVRRAEISPETGERNWELDCLMAEWSAIDPLALLAFSRVLPDSGPRERGCTSAMRAILSRSREQFFGLATDLPKEVNIQPLYDRAILDLAEEDLSAALEQLAKVPRGSVGLYERVSVPIDYAKELTKVFEQASWSARTMGVEKFWSHWLKADQDGALRAYRTKFGVDLVDTPPASVYYRRPKMPVSYKLNGALLPLMENWDSIEALDWGVANCYGTGFQRGLARIARTVFLYGGENGHPVLLRYFSQPPDRLSSLLGEFSGWIPEDRILDLLAILDELGEQPHLNRLRQNLCVRLYRTDPALAAQQIKLLPETGNRVTQSSAWTSVARALAPDFEAACRVLRENCQGHSERAFSDLFAFDGRLSFSPFDIAEQLEHMPGAWLRENLVVGAAGDFAEHDLPSAIDWAGSIEESRLRSAAWEKITERWIQIDPDEASRWLATIPLGVERDPATVKLISSKRLGIFERLQWALTISDDAKKTYVVQSLLKRFDGSQPIERFHAIRSVDVADDLRKNLYRYLFDRE